jgi:alkyl hydroperoxide reductase subunit AhpF
VNLNSQETAMLRQRRLQSVEKISIPIQQLNRDESKDLKEFLNKISKLSQKLVNLVDASEDISVSFAVYEGLEQLAGIDLTAEDQDINLELPSL